MFARLVQSIQPLARCASTAKAAATKTAKVVMLQNVPKVGIRGQQLKVSKGFARNHLIPKRFAKLIASTQSSASASESLTQEQKDANEDRLFINQRLTQIRLIMKRHYPDAEKTDAPLHPIVAADIAAKLKARFGLNLVHAEHLTLPEGKLVTPGWYKIPVNIPSLDFQAELTVKLAMR